jgi:hypothetical protein
MTRLRTRALVGLIVLAMAAGLFAGAASAAPPMVDDATYLRDVQAGAESLRRFGVILQNTSGIADLKAKSNRARTLLTQFDRRMYVIGRYRVPSPTLNRQRARLARSGPPVTAILSRFLDAALTEDVDEVQRLVPIVTQRINAFQRAASG